MPSFERDNSPQLHKKLGVIYKKLQNDVGMMSSSLDIPKFAEWYLFGKNTLEICGVLFLFYLGID